jgi:tripartite ATP-independent transporter DctM subunit
MSALTIAALSFPALLALIFLRVPIGLAMFATGFVGLVLVTGDTTIPLGRLQTESFSTFATYSLSIIPMFLLMGYFATLGGLSQALFAAAAALLGHRRGGVAMAAIGASAGFGAICGSSLATAATMGRVALPELRKHGYDSGFACATLAAGGTLGILIPPSVVLVIYAILTEQNIAKLFLAALVPGVMAALGYMLVIAAYVRLRPDAAGPRLSPLPLRDRVQAVVRVWPVLLVFALVVGGIYAGWFTPTEGAAVGAMGTGVIAWANGGLTRATMTEALLGTARASAMIFFIIFGAAFYNGFLAITLFPQHLAAFVAVQDIAPLTVLLAILCFYLLLGCVMDSLSMILLTIPIFWPVVQGLDFGFVTMADLHAARALEALRAGATLAPDMLAQVQAAIASGAELSREQIQALGLRRVNALALERANTEAVAIWFGILVLIVVEVGLITPPVGMNLFVINAMTPDTKVTRIYRAIWPFVLSDILRVALLIALPALVLFLLPL